MFRNARIKNNYISIATSYKHPFSKNYLQTLDLTVFNCSFIVTLIIILETKLSCIPKSLKGDILI